MAIEHIESLEITNFKCFKHLTVSDIGKVNLIGGKNNVGKTAFLEAVELFAYSDNPQDLFISTQNILQRRQEQKNKEYKIELDFFNANDFTVLCNEKKKITAKFMTMTMGGLGLEDSNVNSIEKTIRFSIQNLIDINKKNKPDTALFIIEDICNLSVRSKYILSNATKNNSCYISSAKLNEEDIAILLGYLIESRKEEFLNKSLEYFDNNILAIKPIMTKRGLTLKLELKNQKNLVLLSSLGEGINRYIAILCAIWASKDGVLLIDEIENGIHYTNYKKLWEIIFKASVDANCQLFITTHSKECIMAFNEAQFEYETVNASYVELYKSKKQNDLITAVVRDKEQLQYSLSHNGRIRGE